MLLNETNIRITTHLNQFIFENLKLLRKDYLTEYADPIIKYEIQNSSIEK